MSVIRHLFYTGGEMKLKTFIIKYLKITFAALLYSAGIALFLNPNNLAPGGISGLAIIMNEVMPIHFGVGTLIIILNIPIMIAGAVKFGIRFIISSIYTTAISSLAINLMPGILNITGMTDNKMLAAAIGGALLGVSMGLLFRMDTTTGGADIIVKIIRQYRPYLKSGQIFLILDGVVVLISAFAFGNIEVALFAAVAIYISSEFLNRTLYIGDEATLVYIVSEKKQLVIGKITGELDIGATLIHASGAFLGEEKEIIMCVMHKRNLAKVRKMLKDTDSEAFMIVTSANEVFGKGFKDQYKAEV